MRSAETWVFAYLLNALWQVPLVFAVAWLASRMARRRDSALEHRIWSIAFMLEAVLPACSLRPQSVLRFISLPFEGRPVVHGAAVGVILGAGQVQSSLRMTSLWLDAAVLLYAGAVLYSAMRLAIDMYRTVRLRVLAEPVTLEGEARASFERMGRVFHVADVTVASSTQVCGPVVLGVRRQILLLPYAMPSGIPAEDFAAALAHEFAHLRRRDFAKNLMYQLLSLPVAFHPLVWSTRARVAASREALCDALAADAVNGRQRYARSLLRLALNFSERTRSNTTHAIGILDANSFAVFERRVMNLTEKQIEVRGVRRFAVVALSVVLGFGACASAMTLRLQVATPTQQTVAAAPVMLTVPRSGNGIMAQTIVVDIPSGATNGAPAMVHILTPTAAAPDLTVSATQLQDAAGVVAAVVNSEDPQDHIAPGVMAGNIQSKVAPVYPQAAKDAKIQGAVVLKVVIGKDGAIKSLQLVSGPDELVKSAWEAVKQWTYKPYMLNGEPTEVETTITVNYSLSQ